MSLTIPKLRDYQQYCVDKTHEALSKNQNPCIVVPTGGGKSVIIAQTVLDLKAQGKNVALMVHRKELLAQLSITLSRFGLMHNIVAPPNIVSQIVRTQRSEFQKQFYHHGSTIGIISVDTLRTKAKQYEAWIKTVDVVMVDEAAHLLQENKWGQAVAIFPKALVVGYTATPLRLDKKGLGSWNDGCFDTIIQGPKVRELIARGYLSQYKIVAPPSDFEKHLGHVKNLTSDFSAQVIQAAAKKSRIVGDVVENYLKFAKGMQAIVFAPTLEVGKEMEKKFIEYGVRAKFLSSESTDAERYKSVNDFKHNEIEVLLNVDLFDEGFDVPVMPGKKIVEAVHLARPSMSLSKVLQQIGRGLRPSPNKKYAMIIDHVGNIKRHGLPCADRKWSLERPEKKALISKVRTCLSCLAVYERYLTECPYCGATVTSNPSGGKVAPEMVDGDLVLIDPSIIQELEAKTNLEDPQTVMDRVMAAAGQVAGKSAFKNQQLRIAVQVRLRDTIATWAGHRKAEGYSDRQIHKLFYGEFGQTINQCLAEPKLQMEESIKMIEGYF